MTETFNLIVGSGVNNCIVVGDYNYDRRHEPESEEILKNLGMKDVVHDFVSGEKAFTRYPSYGRVEARLIDKIACL